MSAAVATPLAPWRIETEAPSDVAAVTAVVDRAFGPGRFAKTAERLREGATPLVALVAREGETVIGTVRLWPVTIGGRPAAFLGPIAVEADLRSGGVGAALVEAGLAAARDLALDGVLLVGDRPYFGRFGFEVAADVRLPGPADPCRVLWLGFEGRGAAGEVVRGPDAR